MLSVEICVITSAVDLLEKTFRRNDLLLLNGLLLLHTFSCPLCYITIIFHVSLDYNSISDCATHGSHSRDTEMIIIVC